MKNYYYSLFFAACVFVMPCLAQPFTPPCGSQPPTGADFCESTCVRCEINGYTGVNIAGAATGEVYCDQLQVDNAHWIAFVAGTPEIGFEVTPSSCFHGDGLQAAILESCGPDALVCNAGAAGGGNQALFLTYSQFVPGKTYYMLIDGYSADTCNFGIHVVSGSAGVPPLGIPGTPQGSFFMNCLSPGNYSIPTVSGAGYYHWTAPEGASINGMSNDEILQGNTGNSVSIAPGFVSGQICVSVGNNCTNEGQAVCLDVWLHQPTIKILPPVTIPFNNLPYLWPPDNTFVLSMPGSFDLITTLESWQGCDSIVMQQVTILPPSLNLITGTVYWDANNNGVKDPGELPYTAGAVLHSSTGVFTNSDANGSFEFNNQQPGDTIVAISPILGVTVTPPFRKVQNGVSNGYDFGLFPLPQDFDLKVMLSATILRPGFSTWMTITCQNNGVDLITDAVVNLSIPSVIQYMTATLNPASINGNDISWNIGDLQPGQVRMIQIQLQTPIGTAIGTPFTFQVSITPLVDDINPVNNFYTLNTSVFGSYDPNDKLVTPTYVTPGLLANGAPFQYTIRFQNTGNFQADFVRVVDTLGNMVDPTSFQFLASSHPCTWKIRGAGVIEFLFENINLPDSTSNEAGSHGFVTFGIKPKKHLALGTLIQNFCDIYFDFNPPIRTNTASTKVVYFIPGEGLVAQDALIVRPNPAAFFARCDWRTPALAAGRIRLFDVNGLPRLEMPIEAGQTYIQLNVSSLPSGLYFVVLEAGPLLLTNKLVVVSLLPLGWN